MMTIIYLYIAKKQNNIMNLMVYKFFNVGIVIILFNSLSLWQNQNYWNLRKGDVLQLLYFGISYIGSAFIIIKNKYRNNEVYFAKRNYPSALVVFIFFLIFCGYWLLNMDILVQALTNPRMFYANSRIGGGVIYYIILPIGLFLYLYYLSIIDFSKSRYMIVAVFIILVFCGIFYIFGQKSKIITLALIFLSIYAFKRQKKDVNIKIISYGIVLVVGMLFIFSFYFKQQSMDASNILMKLAGYSDYTENFNDLVDNMHGFYFGEINLQDELYSYIPRALWDNKPELFGSLKLGLLVPRLYKWTMAKTGAPSFGPIGSLYADFGIVGICIQIILDWIFIYYANTLNNQIEKDGYNFFVHTIILALVGCPIFSITLVRFPIYQIVVTYIVYKISKLKIKIKS